MIITNNGRVATTNFSANFAISKLPLLMLKATTALFLLRWRAQRRTMSITKHIHGDRKAWSLPDTQVIFSPTALMQHLVSETVLRLTDGLMDSGDCTATDNAVNQSYTVVGAIDPNDIQVVPVGYGKERILYSQTSCWLIRSVSRIMVIMQLLRFVLKISCPKGLDLATLKVVSASREGLDVSMNSNTRKL